MKQNPNCDLCPLHEGVNSVCVWGEWIETGKGPRVMMIGEAPGEQEDLHNQPFIGKAGQLLRMVVKEVGLNKVYITNTVKCRPPENRTPGVREMRACRSYLEAEIRQIDPEYIVLLGKTAIVAVTGVRTASVGMYRNRKNWRLNTAQLIATYHPAAVLRDPLSKTKAPDSLLSKLVDDLGRIYSSEFIAPEEPTIQVCNKSRPVSRALSLDLETTGFSPFTVTGKVLCVAWSTENNKAKVTQNVANVVKMLKDNKPLLIGHNLKFDLLWLREKYNYTHEGPLFDTIVACHLLNEEIPSKSLKYLASLHTGYGDYAKDILPFRDSEKMESLDLQDLLRYCAYDAAATYRLYQIFNKQLREQGLGKLFDAQMEVLRCVVNMEAMGVQINKERMDLACKSLQELLTTETAYLKKRTKIENFDSPKQLAEYLYNHLKLPVLDKTRTGLPSTDESTLSKLEEQVQDPLNKRILHSFVERRKYRKLLSTYVEGIREQLDYKGICHPSFNQCGTVTGRFSCSSPNLQNIPRSKDESPVDVKTFFVARPTKVFIQADYSQIELRIGAFLSRDRSMLGAIRQGSDLHLHTAKAIFHKEEISTEERVAAKTVNFGIFYGIGPRLLSENLKISMSEAKRLIESWFLLYPGVKDWQEQLTREFIEKGYVTNLFGRRRRIPIVVNSNETIMEYKHMVRQACNFPVQSTASDLTLMAMSEIGRNFSVLINVHDSVVVEADSTRVRSTVDKVRYIMENPAWLTNNRFGYKIKWDVPTPVEIKVGPSWGEMEVV